MRLTLLHTAEIHRATFDDLAARIAPEATLVHHVHVAWLESAQNGISPALRDDISQLIKSADGPVICTCTTLGEVAAAAGATRIDTPMMARAAAIGGPVLLVFCVESTRTPSTALLTDAINGTGQTADIRPLFLGALWPLFLAGETEGFHAAIASAVRGEVRQHPDITAVVLAQVSMAGAALQLNDLPVPVLASPEMALRDALGL